MPWQIYRYKLIQTARQLDFLVPWTDTHDIIIAGLWNSSFRTPFQRPHPIDSCAAELLGNYSHTFNPEAAVRQTAEPAILPFLHPCALIEYPDTRKITYITGCSPASLQTRAIYIE